MLLILHNLPKKVNSFDVRQLINEQCGLREVILDNLLDEGPGKRITVGVAEEEDAALLMRKLNGLYYKKCQLYVEDVRKKKVAVPTYPVLIPAGLQPQAQKPWLQYHEQKPAETLQSNQSKSNNMPYYLTQDSNNMNGGNQTQTTQQDTSIFNPHYKYKSNDILQTLKATNFMTYPLAPNSNNFQAPHVPSSFKKIQNDRDKQGDRRDNTTQFNWRQNKSPLSNRHESFGNFNQRESGFGDKTSERNKNSEAFRLSGNNDRSPPCGRNLFRENKKADRREDFDSSRRSRSNPRDKNAYMNERQSGSDQNSCFSRQRDREFDQHEGRNVQKRNFEQVERNARGNIEGPDRSFGNVFENSTTFSSTPENASFTKTNRSNIDKIRGSREFGETSNNNVQFPSPKQYTFKQQVSFPSTPKRSRFDPPPQYFGNKKYVNPNAPSNKETDFQKMMTRNTNWRVESASLLAKEVLKNATSNKIEGTMFKTVLKKLRECVMLRLDVIMGDKIATNLDEILRGYRSKFNYRDDINFFKAVMEKIERENEKNADEVTGPNVTPLKPEQLGGKLNKGHIVTNPQRADLKPNLAASGNQKGLISPNQPKMPFIKDPRTMPRLPKYPNCDKQGFKQSKKNALLEHEAGFYIMEPDFERAVNEEIEKLVECYVRACEPSSNKDENILRNKIMTSTADEFKSIMRLNITKRVLNVSDGLALRIFSTPKPPPRAALDDFFKKHGAISLKKADTKKMFIAHCDSYESYDRLLAIQTANFGSVTIHIKPFQVLGPVTKKNENVNKITAVNIAEDFTKDVDELEIDLTSDLNDDGDGDDVMMIENEQTDVVVIRDELDQSSNSDNTSDVDVNNERKQEFNDVKEHHSNVKVDDSNTVSASTEKVTAVTENIFNYNDKDDSKEGVHNINEKVNNSDTEKKYASRDVANSQSEELDTSETNVLESLDDIFNEANEIMEDDLEDF